MTSVANLNKIEFTKNCAQRYFFVVVCKFKIENSKKKTKNNRIVNYDENRAHKVADNDLKGLICYFNCNISDVCFPIMSIIDYNGFRIIAQSKLPIDSS